MRIALRCALVVAMCSFIAEAQQVLSPDQLYARAKSSVVTILTFDSNHKSLGQGSGFIVRKNRIVTNYHVVEGSSSGLVVFSDGSTASATTVIAGSVPKDIVILEADTGTRAPLVLGDELQLKEGDTVYAIGSPKGLSASLSNGLVSGFRQDAGQFFIQTTAPIASGSSGGPLLDVRGRVVGVTTSRLRDSSFGFAVGATDIEHLLKVPLSVPVQLSQLSNKKDSDSDDELAAARQFYEKKQYSDALSSFQALSSDAKSGFDGQLLLCKIYAGLNKFASASKACDSAISITPESAEAHFEKAYSQYMGGDLAGAEKSALRATRLSKDGQYSSMLALIYYIEQKYTLVSEQLNPETNDTFELNLLAGTALHLGDRDAFRRYHNKVAAAKGANNGWQLYFDGYTAQQKLDFDTALDKYRKCDADKDFIDPACLIEAIHVEVTQGKYEFAKKDIEAGISRYPRNHEFLSSAIFLNLVTGNVDEASRYHLQLKDLPPEAEDEFTDCLYYYGLNQPSIAATHCSATLTKQNEGNYAVWSNAGYVALDGGQFQDALRYFSTATAAFYNSKEKHLVMQEVDLSWGRILSLYFSGDKKEAKKLFGLLKKAYPQFVTLNALSQLPLVWSVRTKESVSRVIADFK